MSWRTRLVEAVKNRYAEKEKQFSPDLLRWLERRIILDVVDTQWKDHLLSLDHLKEGIGLRGTGRKIRWWSSRRKRSFCSKT